MTLILETPYVTFTITKKNRKHPKISNILGFTLYQRVSWCERNFIIKLYRDIGSWAFSNNPDQKEKAFFIAIDNKLKDWTLYTEDQNSPNSIYYNSDLVNTVIDVANGREDDYLNIDLIKGIELCLDAECEHSLTINLNKYDIDFKFNTTAIKLNNLNLEYQDIDLSSNAYALVFNSEKNRLRLILPSKDYCIGHIDTFLKICHPKQKLLRKNEYTYTGNFEALRILTVSVNTPRPTPDQEISLYQLVQPAIAISNKQDYKLYIHIDNYVVDAVIHKNKVKFTLKT